MCGHGGVCLQLGCKYCFFYFSISRKFDNSAHAQIIDSDWTLGVCNHGRSGIETVVWLWSGWFCRFWKRPTRRSERSTAIACWTTTQSASATLRLSLRACSEAEESIPNRACWRRGSNQRKSSSTVASKRSREEEPKLHHQVWCCIDSSSNST